MNSNVAAQSTILTLATTVTQAQWHNLLALREQYRQGRDFFSAREHAYLRFMRWLYQTGRLEP